MGDWENHTSARLGEASLSATSYLLQHLICWMDEHVRILMAGLRPSVTTNLKIGATGTAGGGFAGYGMYVLGYPGDYLDVTNHRVISAKTFHKDYKLIDKGDCL